MVADSNSHFYLSYKILWLGSADLKAIEGGDQGYLDWVYPNKIEGVTRNSNLLLARERAHLSN